MGKAITGPFTSGVARAVLAVMVGGAMFGCSPQSGRQAAAPSPSASVQPSASPSSVRARLEMPMRLGNRSQFSHRPLAFAVADTVEQLGRLVDDPRDQAGKFYNGQTDADYAVLVSAAAGTVRDEEATLNEVFRLFPRVREVRSVDPGPLGGVAGCGNGRNDQYYVTMCAWADRVSVGTVTFLSPKKRLGSPDDEFVEIRSLVESHIPGLPSGQ
ncbi:hypothetical protein SAMN05444365_102189 [Micromonospora pattaloongensis]|uniref:Lipoprotein n=1 Tax=Micromonospora pattaloongensis TaxID=405436 RepID=A0A1H3JN09_9ACTN|nr:hypothetical protein [Micromonospora pattaloongensis]SDY41370.1 hypothetical protein SAMN05444365_102189 [Micromonospora pattaloongensis]